MNPQMAPIGAQVLANAMLQGPTMNADGPLVFRNDTVSAVCPDGFQENSNERIAGGGYILCMQMVDWPPAPSQQVVTGVVVKTGPAKKGWNGLKCPGGYTKVPFGNSDTSKPMYSMPQVPLGVPGNATTVAAVCLRFETKGAAKGRSRRLVAGLEIVASQAECAALGSAWRVVPGNIGAAWPGSVPSYLCTTTLGASP